MTEILWEGEHDGMKARIRQAGEDDCIVEVHISYHGEERWDALNDDAACAAVYMRVFLEARTHLTRLYDRDMGNLRLKEGLDALEGVGGFLRRDG